MPGSLGMTPRGARRIVVTVSESEPAERLGARQAPS